MCQIVPKPQKNPLFSKDVGAVENYCAREGLAFRCVRHSSRLPNGPRLPADPAPMLCCWPSGPHALCCGAYPIAA